MPRRIPVLKLSLRFVLLSLLLLLVFPAQAQSGGHGSHRSHILNVTTRGKSYPTFAVYVR